MTTQQKLEVWRRIQVGMESPDPNMRLRAMLSLYELRHPRPVRLLLHPYTIHALAIADPGRASVQVWDMQGFRFLAIPVEPFPMFWIDTNGMALVVAEDGHGHFHQLGELPAETPTK